MSAVEAFTEPVLHQPSRCDEVLGDLVVFRPGQDGIADELGAVVRGDHARLAAVSHQSRQFARHRAQRRAQARRWACCSFLRSCRRFRGRRIRRTRPRRRGIRLGRFGIAHRWPIERKTMGVVPEAVEDSVGESRIDG